LRCDDSVAPVARGVATEDRTRRAALSHDRFRAYARDDATGAASSNAQTITIENNRLKSACVALRMKAACASACAWRVATRAHVSRATSNDERSRATPRAFFGCVSRKVRLRSRRARRLATLAMRASALERLINHVTLIARIVGRPIIPAIRIKGTNYGESYNEA
jgi:hypothetical protein